MLKSSGWTQHYFSQDIFNLTKPITERQLLTHRNFISTDYYKWTISVLLFCCLDNFYKFRQTLYIIYSSTVLVFWSTFIFRQTSLVSSLENFRQTVLKCRLSFLATKFYKSKCIYCLTNTLYSSLDCIFFPLPFCVLTENHILDLRCRQYSS